MAGRDRERFVKERKGKKKPLAASRPLASSVPLVAAATARSAVAMSSCGYHSPRFSEDIAWLPQWLQPHRQPAVGEHRKDSAGVSSPSCENCVFIGDHAQEQQSCQSATVNAGGYSGFRLHLSGDEDTPTAITPTSGDVPPFSLHLSSENATQLSSAQANGSPQILNSGTCKGPLEGSYVDGQAQEVNAVPRNKLEAKALKDDKLLEVCRVASKEINKPLDARRHQVPGGKVDVRKLRNADVNDAVELSIAASEAMVIAEMILNDCQSDKLAAAAIEAALHVKEARKQCFLEDPEHTRGSSENELDESDWLSELDETEMFDVFQDVGLSLVQTACSSQGHNTSDLKQQISQPGCPPCDGEAHILEICSSEKQSKRWHSQDANTNDQVPDSLADNNSAGMLQKESTPGCDSVKQTTSGKTMPFPRNRETALQKSTKNNCAFARSLMTLVSSQNILKDGGGIGAQTHVGSGTRKHVKELFNHETSFISESMGIMDDCPSASRAASMEMVASSRASFPCKTEGFCEENQGAEAAESCYQVVCSSLSLADPLCSFVPCSISCNEGSTSQTAECKQRKGEENVLIYPKEPPRKQDLDVEADPSSAPFVKAPESNVPWTRRKYSSLRPFSTTAPISNILGGSATHNDVDVVVCQKEIHTPKILNKKIQRVQASNQFIENNVEAGSLKEFSVVQKKSSYAQGNSEHQSREQHIPSEVCPQSTTHLNVGKRDLKRKGVQFLEAKLSTRRTKSRRTKSLFSWSDSRIIDTLEPREYINNKDAIFHGLEFLLTGFQSHKEKEIESLIRKFGGYVLSKVPSYPHNKKSKLAVLARWKPPMVLSPKKVSTAKFLYGCAVDSSMLNPNWLFDSLQAGVLLPPGKYLIRQRHAVNQIATFGQSLHLKNNTSIFDGVGFLIHGKTSFCSKFSNIIKHGGGQVFVSLQGLVQSLQDKSSSHGIILVANEASASRHLSHCGLEHDIKTAPASWIVGSLFYGKLIPLKKNRCVSFHRIKMPSFQQQQAFDMSQEI